MLLVELPPVITSVMAYAVVMSMVKRSLNGSANTIGMAVCATVDLFPAVSKE